MPAPELPLFIDLKRLGRVPAIRSSLRKLVFDRYSYRCALCMEVSSTLHVHHIIDRHELLNYGAGDPHNIDMLMPLCEGCHGRAKDPVRTPAWHLLQAAMRLQLLNTRPDGEVTLVLRSISLTVFVEARDSEQVHCRIMLPPGVFGCMDQAQARRGLDLALKHDLEPHKLLRAFARRRKVDAAVVLERRLINDLRYRISSKQPRLLPSFSYQLMYGYGCLYEQRPVRKWRCCLDEFAAQAMDGFSAHGDVEGMALVQRMRHYAVGSRDRVVGLSPDEARRISRYSATAATSADAYYDTVHACRYLCEDALKHREWDAAVEFAVRAVHCLDLASMPDRPRAYATLGMALMGRFVARHDMEDALRSLFAFSSAWQSILVGGNAEQGGDVALKYSELLCLLGRSDLGDRVLRALDRHYGSRFHNRHNGLAHAVAKDRLRDLKRTNESMEMPGALWVRLREMAYAHMRRCG